MSQTDDDQETIEAVITRFDEKVQAWTEEEYRAYLDAMFPPGWDEDDYGVSAVITPSS